MKSGVVPSATATMTPVERNSAPTDVESRDERPAMMLVELLV